MSKIEVKELTTLSGETELTLGESSKTIAVPSGATLDIKSGATIANNGTATGFGGGGKILQVVQGMYSTPITTTSTSYISTGLQASITPSSTSSKILVLAKISGLYSNPTATGNSGGSYISLYRDGSLTSSMETNSFSGAYAITADTAINFLDSPLSTSSLNYEIYFRSNASNSSTCHNNNFPSTIILMEVSG